MERLEGAVETVTYQNEDTGYTVLRLSTVAGLCTCVGCAPAARAGVSVALEGDWVQHKRFGRQFAFERYDIVRPATAEGVVRFLESGLVSNIGSKRARLIVEKFGAGALDIIDSSPERLSEIPGIGRRTIRKIKDSWARQRHIRDLALFLQEHGISAATANRLYKTYGDKAKMRICENPYSLIDDIWGIGFIKADALAVKIGFDANSYKRIKAGLIYALQNAATAGHTYLPKSELETTAAELLGVTPEQILYTLDHCVNQNYLICQDECVYLPYLYAAETGVAQRLSERIRGKGASNRERSISDKEIDNFIIQYEKRTGWIGAPEQLEAVRIAAKSGIFILTGGPGTGKTTVLQVIVALFKEMGLKVELAAPTGRAAARMGSISGIAARTIHRLLEFKPGGKEGGFTFQRCETNPINADAVILDEVSMVDILLMKSFIAAVRNDTKLILVGDKNQLPSVGPGNVLADLIACPRIPHVELKRVFRQSAMSRIVTAAHEIIGGETPEFSNSAADNCFLMTENDPEKCLETIVDLVSRRLPARYGLDPMADIQVLSPMHRGTLGTISLNAALQSALNQNEKKIRIGQNTFVLGDRVIQAKNNYEAGVFNGDIGFIAEIDDGKVTIAFDKTPAVYEERDLDQIIPGYCISIHKSQGSEFKAVVIPVSTQHFIMLQRNLIYTGLTRAKELCVFIGSRRALGMAVQNDKALTRNSRLTLGLA
ncbi:recombinase RecD [Fibrobacteres bacterium R8-0-B4]